MFLISFPYGLSWAIFWYYPFQGFHHMPETRGLCLSEEQTVTSVWFLDIGPLLFFYLVDSVSELVFPHIICWFVPFYNMQILKRPRIGGHRLVGMRTQPQKLTRRCEVTAILVLYGLPRYILIATFVFNFTFYVFSCWLLTIIVI